MPNQLLTVVAVVFVCLSLIVSFVAGILGFAIILLGVWKFVAPALDGGLDSEAVQPFVMSLFKGVEVLFIAPLPLVISRSVVRFLCDDIRIEELMRIKTFVLGLLAAAIATETVGRITRMARDEDAVRWGCLAFAGIALFTTLMVWIETRNESRSI